jgi:hypothetical protein
MAQVRLILLVYHVLKRKPPAMLGQKPQETRHVNLKAPKPPVSACLLIVLCSSPRASRRPWWVLGGYVGARSLKESLARAGERAWHCCLYTCGRAVEKLGRARGLFTWQAASVGERPRLREQTSRLREQTSRLREQPSRLREQPSRLREQPSRLREQTSRLHEQPSRLREQTSRLHEQPSRLREQPSRLREQPSRLREQTSRLREQTSRQCRSTSPLANASFLVKLHTWPKAC